MRDKLYEQHPPAWPAKAEIQELRDGLRRKLAALGVSKERIAKMETALVIQSKATQPTRKRWFEYSAARALFFASRFDRSVKENNWQAAACYSLWMGRAAQIALERETSLMEMGWTRLSRKSNNNDTWQKIRCEVEKHILKKRGLGSAKELHAHLKIEAQYGWKLKKFSRRWSEDKIGDFKAATRKKFTS